MSVQVLKRRLTLVAITVACGLALSSCDFLLENPADGPVAIIRAGDSVRDAVCDPVSIVGVRMSQRGEVGAWSVFWQFEKQLALSSGDVLASADADALGVDAGANPAMAPRDDILVVLDQGDTAVRAQFTIGGDGLSETLWLHPDGTQTSEPCSPS